MKFRVDRDVLADAVTWTARSLPTRPPVPSWQGCRSRPTRRGLSLSSFDYEVSARSRSLRTSGAGFGPGQWPTARGHLPGPAGQAGRRRDRRLQVVVTCGRPRFTLLTMPVEDYPTLPRCPARPGTLDGDAFTAAVAQVSIAASRDDTLPLLTGVRLEIEG